ncbi:hypothetical protein VXS03_04390 [Photobacterium sp. S4TG1]|uniref:hypothetical protein n=1 Tax=Photobacterium sp. S4TG1 TaxID=3114587 RepID=UPI002E16FC51|nr:hypothetical protein [Photobacterium sp. S4TG1]
MSINTDIINNRGVTLPQLLMTYNLQQDLWQLDTENIGNTYDWTPNRNGRCRSW